MGTPGRPLGSTRLMKPKHKEILRRLLLGQSQREIAQTLGMSEVGVSQIVNTSKFQQNLQLMEAALEETFVDKLTTKEIEDPVRERLDSYKLEAIDTVYRLMREAESEQVRRTSAQDILDRAGYKPREVVETSHSFSVDPHTSDNINTALQDLGVRIGEDYDEEGEEEEGGEGGE